MILRAKFVANNYISRCGCTSVTFMEGVNILVGPNGSGKSSSIEAIMRVVNGADSVPVAQDGEASKKITNDSESHGEALMRYMRALDNITDPTTVVMDEPEIGLDYSAIAELARLIESKPNLQFIIATHSPLLQTIADANILVFGEDSDYLRKGLRLCMRRLEKVL